MQKQNCAIQLAEFHAVVLNQLAYRFGWLFVWGPTGFPYVGLSEQCPPNLIAYHDFSLAPFDGYTLWLFNVIIENPAIFHM